MITIDQQLPDTTGLALVREIRRLQKESRPKIIIISAVHDKKEIQSILQLGVDDYLLKPFKKTKLVSIVKRIMWEHSDTDSV